MVDLPLLLGGPIIRRAETSGIWIWLATSEAVYEVNAFLYPFDEDGKAKAQYWSASWTAPSAFFRCVRLGKKLWVTLFKIAIKYGEFPKDVILGYNFSIRTSSGETSLEKLVGDNFRQDLCYSPFPLPTLFLQSSNGNLAQGSCRRPGALGNDAFHDFDSMLRNVCRDIKRRPASFFLTGDQIYADDVAYPLFVSIRSLCIDIMGYIELLPDPQYLNTYRLIDSRTIRYTFDESDNNTRRPFVLQAGLTTDDGEGHLLTFGEFAAMYLLVWNPELCTIYQLEKIYPGQVPGQKNLKDFIKRVAEARRVLANIPTYMSFDDHEITDDWNLDKKWIEGTNTFLARHILANGLAAFWFFQGWGNDPQLQGEKPGVMTTDLIENHLMTLLKSPKDQEIDDSYEEAILKREPYAFVAPTMPPVVVTDMRMHRKFTDPTSLLNKDAYAHLAKICKGLPPNKPIAFLSGSPLLNWAPVSKVREISSFIIGSSKARKKFEVGDLWDDHSEGRVRLIQWIHDIIKPSYCVIFSGDVHYGSFIKGKASVHANKDQFLLNPPAIWSLDIVQITSSPMKNEEHKLRDGFPPIIEIPLGSILNSPEFSTKGGDVFSFPEKDEFMILNFDAVGFQGPLVDFIDWAKMLPTTLIYFNHICIVDFSKQNRVKATFFSKDSYCSGEVNF